MIDVPFLIVVNTLANEYKDEELTSKVNLLNETVNELLEHKTGDNYSMLSVAKEANNTLAKKLLLTDHARAVMIRINILRGTS